MDPRRLGGSTSGWLPTMRGATDSVSLRRELTDMPALLESSLAPLYPVAVHHRIQLRVAALADVPRAAIDRDKIAWTVVTLAGNALRYVSRGNENEAGGSVLVHLDHDAAQSELSIAVQDDGPGVPVEKLPYLFERRPGALHAEGLALALVRDIVSAHGGRIEVESRSDQDEHGTSVTVVLPCASR